MDNNVFERDILDYVGGNQELRNKILKSRIIGKPITLENFNKNRLLTTNDLYTIIYNIIDLKNSDYSIEEFKEIPMRRSVLEYRPHDTHHIINDIFINFTDKGPVLIQGYFIHEGNL